MPVTREKMLKEKGDGSVSVYYLREGAYLAHVAHTVRRVVGRS